MRWLLFCCCDTSIEKLNSLPLRIFFVPLLIWPFQAFVPITGSKWLGQQNVLVFWVQQIRCLCAGYPRTLEHDYGCSVLVQSKTNEQITYVREKAELNRASGHYLTGNQTHFCGDTLTLSAIWECVFSPEGNEFEIESLLQRHSPAETQYQDYCLDFFSKPFIVFLLFATSQLMLWYSHGSQTLFEFLSCSSQLSHTQSHLFVLHRWLWHWQIGRASCRERVSPPW